MERSKKHEAAAQFAKLQREQGAKKATSAYEITAAQVRAKTERLRALRLARDAAAPPAVPAAAQRNKQKKAKSYELDRPVGQVEAAFPRLARACAPCLCRRP